MSDKEELGVVTLKYVRLGFPFLFERGKPQKRDDGTMTEGNYRASGIMYRSGEHSQFTAQNMKLLKVAKEDVLAAKFTGGDKSPAAQKKWPKIKPEKICVRDGDLENWDGFENSWYISASENEQPLLLSRQKDEKGIWMPATREILYAGCFVNMIVRLWVQDNDHGQRVNANLRAVQFYKRGPAFSASAPIDPSKAFTDIEEDEGEDIGGSSFNEDDDDDSVI